MSKQNEQNVGRLNHKFTQDKTPELALYYNVACDRMARFIYREGVGKVKVPVDGKTDKEQKHWEDTIKLFRDMKKGDTDTPFFPVDLYNKMKGYLWKGFNKGLSEDHLHKAAPITDEEKMMVRRLLVKLDELRNFQSHYYHDDAVLFFNLELQEFVKGLYERALNAQRKETSGTLVISEGSLFVQDPNVKSCKLSYEGKNFLLSLFLTTGEMKRFLQQRKFCKRDDADSIVDYKLKHDVYTYYCHRDGAARVVYNQDAGLMDGFEADAKLYILQKRQLYKLDSYLNDVSEAIIDPDLFPLFFKDGRVICGYRDLIEFNAEKDLLGDFYLDWKKWKDEAGNEMGLIAVSDNEFYEAAIYVSEACFHKMLLDEMRLPDGVVSNRINRLLKKELRRAENSEEKAGCKSAVPQETRYLDLYYDERRKEGMEEEPGEFGGRKPRQKDMFMRFAVQYILDKKVLPNVCWQWQLLKGDKEAGQETTCFSAADLSLEGSWRLKFGPDDHILFINKPCDKRTKYMTRPLMIDGAKSPDKGHRRSHQRFLVGHRAMRNLLIAHFDGKGVEPFFKTLEENVSLIYEGNGLDQLDEKAIPACFKSKTIDRTAELRLAVKQRIDYLIGTEAEGSASSKHQGVLQKTTQEWSAMSRADKNRQIMQCYRLFEWKRKRAGKSPDEKFLRESEYEKLSIYHYSLEELAILAPQDDRYQRIKALLDKIPAFKDGRMPEVLKEGLKKAKGLDDLLADTLSKTIDYLVEQRASLEDSDPSALEQLARKLGVPVYDRKGKKEYGHIPWAIHPDLIVRHTYRKDCQTEGFSISKKIWKDEALQKCLYSANYNAQLYFDFWTEAGDIGGELFRKNQKQMQRTIIGRMNESRTYDGLLFKMARAYDSNYQKVGGMSTEWIEIYPGKGKEAEQMELKDGKKKDARVKVKYKQMDDVLVMMAAGRLKKGLKLYLSGIDSKQYEKVEVCKEGECGIPFIEIKRVTDRVYQQSLDFIAGVLAFEEKVVKKDEAKALAKARENAGKKRLGFNQILELAGKKDMKIVGGEKLSGIRNRAFHLGIPEQWSYESLVENETLKEHFPIIRDEMNRRIEKRVERRELYS